MNNCVAERSLSFVKGRDIQEAIRSDRASVIRVVRDTYVAHRQGRTVNPDSAFLRLLDSPHDRMIALPAHVLLENGSAIAGIKWIASCPRNTESGIPRASAVIVLNDLQTGFPRVCLEGSVISAARTAASAVLAADALTAGQNVADSLGVIGCGVIASHILDFMATMKWRIDRLQIHDRFPSRAEAFGQRFRPCCEGNVHFHANAEAVVSQSDVVIFTTTAQTPYINSPLVFAHKPLVLHISLRDLAPEVILSAHNVVDDVEHCLKANTSAHLAEQLAGNRDFVRFTLPGILNGEALPDHSRPIVFSPFGMGILDIAVAQWVVEKVQDADSIMKVPDFFPTP